MKRTLIIIVAALALLSLAAPAEADYDFRRYHFRAGQPICVEDHSGRHQATRIAIRRWNSRGARLMLRRDCGTWQDHRAIIVINRLYYDRSNVVGSYATLEAWESEGVAARGFIQLNRYAPRPRQAACVRRWVITHELGHAFGLTHTHRHSVMNDWDWHECGRLTRNDRIR